METSLLLQLLGFHFQVLILPMRNGNIKNGYIDERVIKSSYPTYEEWKHSKITPVEKINLVLILPMRNGNQVGLYQIVILSNMVLILPMRNGNFSQQHLLVFHQ